MSPRTKTWLEKALSKGVDNMTAYMGSEVIESWAEYWKFEIPDESLDEMIFFALQYPETALHRWDIMRGPCPYLPQDDVVEKLRDNPKYSILDSIAEQRK